MKEFKVVITEDLDESSFSIVVYKDRNDKLNGELEATYFFEHTTEKMYKISFVIRDSSKCILHYQSDYRMLHCKNQAQIVGLRNLLAFILTDINDKDSTIHINDLCNGIVRFVGGSPCDSPLRMMFVRIMLNYKFSFSFPEDGGFNILKFFKDMKEEEDYYYQSDYE